MARELVEDYYYPYPSHVNVAYFVSVRLSGRDDTYNVWETQMLCVFVSHGMLGFVDGTFVRPTMMDRAQSCSRGNKKGQGDSIKSKYELWRRSDALVKGWILGSLTEEVVKDVVGLLTAELDLLAGRDFTAKELWDKLRSVCGPISVIPAHSQPVTTSSDSEDEEIQIVVQSRRKENPMPEETQEQAQKEAEEKAKEQAEERAKIQQNLYEYTLKGHLWDIKDILQDGKVTITDKISINGNTTLHVAIGTGQSIHFIDELLELVPSDTLLGMRNSEGSTLLHVAAIAGNIDAAMLLVRRNQDLLYAEDNDGCKPLARALSNMHIDLFLYLMDLTERDEKKSSLIDGESGDELLVNAISSRRFAAALKLVGRSPTMKSNVALMAIAQNFPRELTILGSKTYSRLTNLEAMVIGCLDSAYTFYREHENNVICSCFIYPLFVLFFIVVWGLYFLLWTLAALVLKIRQLQDIDYVNDQASNLLRSICSKIKRSNDSSSHHLYFTDPILEAAKLNAYQVVEHLVSIFPNAIWSTNEDGHNIIQVAVINRSESVYNLLYQMSEHKNVYKTIKDSSGNNLLHLIGRLAPSNKLNLISGATLQIQRELQWFQEVKKFVCPLNIMQKNSSNETPQMVFTREHKDLVIEGEKWMKATAESYTITAALITTIVFAAAITVPGGSNQITGIPIFTNNVAFTIFAVSDAISLFTSTTSLLMFLSVLTSRFAEQDFLFALPTKLIIGLATLFVSTTAMLVAFSTTLFLVFSHRNSWILIPIALLTCLPITSFVTLQYPLIADLIGSTYGRSIFDLLAIMDSHDEVRACYWRHCKICRGGHR